MLAAWGLAAVMPVSAFGDFLYQFGDVFGGTAPGSNPPWMVAEVQSLAPGRVRLSLSNSNLSGSENVDELYLNLNPSLDPTRLKFSLVGGSGGFDQPRILTGENQFKAGGDGRYDVEFLFAQGGTAANRFGPGEELVCDISGLPTLTAADFAFLSMPVGGSRPLYAAAHVQRIGASSLSGWLDATAVTPLVVPEPTAGGLWLLAFVVGWRIRKR